MGWLRTIYWTVVRFLLHLRYRVHITGLADVPKTEGPLLVLPNHPGYVDPAIVMSHVQLGRSLRPLVFSGMYRNPVLYPFMRIVNALEVPDLRAHSRDSHDRAMELIERVVERVKAGDSFIIYPSGRLQRTGREVVGGARMVYEILRRCPELHVVRVRTRGVWGSSFSCAATGDLPPLNRVAAKAVAWNLLSVIFGMPRRTVRLQIESIQPAGLPLHDKAAFNGYLEQWYNADGGESPTFVPYHAWWGPRSGNFATTGVASDIDWTTIKPAIWQAVHDLVEERLGRPLSEEERQPTTTLDELGMDSLDRMDIALHIEHQFGFRSEQVAATLGELAALADGKLSSAGEAPRKLDPQWFAASSNRRPAEVLGETLATAFVARARHQLRDAALADELSGVLTFRRLLVGAHLLSRRLQPLPGKAVGLMLPASVATDLSFMALQLAGKLPVMLNWTTGPANLEHAMRTLQVKHVVTSRRFLDRLGIELPGAEPIFVEDLRKSIGKAEGAWALLKSYLAPQSLLPAASHTTPDQPAVILFTSGSESLPKAVPLTHDNLLANIRAGVKAMDFQRDDALLGFLPPFHSFGLTANMLMPLLTGTRVVHYPDPTNARGLAKVIEHFRPTLLFATPTFLGYIFQVSASAALSSLRMIMTGAEKCPDRLREQSQALAPQAVMLEGYGITECSPVVSVNRVDKVKPGTIGIPLDGVSHLIVDPESHAPTLAGTPGLLLVRGPTIFSGYLNYDGPDPFITVQGFPWYNTGDLVLEDEDGFLHFRGRLKRFLKAGGEMISLPALEEPFQVKYPADEMGPCVAVEGVETSEGRHIVLFVRGFELSLRDANAHLVQAGLRGVMRLDEVRTVTQIPVLGTGKTDYKVLRKWVLESPSLN